jgi:hypothetical protein
VTAVLREAVTWYQAACAERIDRGGAPDIVCNHLTRRFGDFGSPARAEFCTSIAAEVAAITAEALRRFAPDLALTITPVEGA